MDKEVDLDESDVSVFFLLLFSASNALSSESESETTFPLEEYLLIKSAGGGPDADALPLDVNGLGTGLFLRSTSSAESLSLSDEATSSVLDVYLLKTSAAGLPDALSFTSGTPLLDNAFSPETLTSFVDPCGIADGGELLVACCSTF